MLLTVVKDAVELADGLTLAGQGLGANLAADPAFDAVLVAALVDSVALAISSLSPVAAEPVGVLRVKGVKTGSHGDGSG